MLLLFDCETLSCRRRVLPALTSKLSLIHCLRYAHSQMLMPPQMPSIHTQV